MKEQFPYRIKNPLSKTEKQEFSQAEKTASVCRICGSIYYKKSWYHNKNSKSQISNSKFTLCPACQMIRNKTFEGQLTIVNFPVEIKQELINLIKGFCRRAFERDPLDRLIDIKIYPDKIIATATENQLTVKLAKKIKDSFKKVKTKISYSSAPSDAVYVEIKF